MKRSRLKISGIYDPRTIEFLRSEQLDSFGFDFLPLSLNFIPGHTFDEILKKYFNRDHHYFLNFSEEPDFVIKKTLNDISSNIGTNVTDLSNIYLQFSSEVSTSYAEQFSMKYFLNTSPLSDLKSFEGRSHLRGLSYSYSHLESLGDHNQLFKKLTEIFQWAEKFNIQIELRVDWGASFSSSILDFFEFEYFNFGIGPKVESCYRNVNLGLIGKEVKHIRDLVL